MSPTRFRALLIGNWDYADPSHELVPLKGPRNDVERLQKALTDQHLGLFDDGDVTVRSNLKSQEIGRELLTFLDGAAPDDRLLIYFSGHGERLVQQQLGLCGIDVDRRYRFTDCFDTANLRALLEERNRSASTVIVLDCCYAGQMKGPGLTEETLATSFGNGTFVLSSGGNEPSNDAMEDDAASPFTAALVDALLDPALEGDHGGHVTVDDVFTALDRRVPPLLPRPRRNVQSQGSLPIARRPVADQTGAQARPELKGFRTEQEFEVVELVFDGPTVLAKWGSGEEERLTLDRLDEHRLAAIRRLGELSDAVMRVREYSDDADWRGVVRRAWDCVGANLFETAIPPALGRRLLAVPEVGGEPVLDLRLRFEGEGRALMAYPWEYLHFDQADPDAVNPLLPLGLNEGLVVERFTTDEPARSAPARSATAPVVPTVAVVNSLRAPFALTGELAARYLDELSGVNVVAELPAARWGDFLDSLDQRPHYLLLFAPVVGQHGPSDIGFAGASPDAPDWRSVTEVAAELRNAGLCFECLVLVSFAAMPGRNSVPGTFDVARRLVEADVGPVAFVCHAPGYERHVGGAGAPTFPALLVDTLTRPEPPPLTHALHYARSRVVRLANDEARATFGVPGVYRAPEPAGGPDSGQRGMAPAGPAPAPAPAGGRPGAGRQGLPR